MNRVLYFRGQEQFPGNITKTSLNEFIALWPRHATKIKGESDRRELKLNQSRTFPIGRGWGHCLSTNHKPCSVISIKSFANNINLRLLRLTTIHLTFDKVPRLFWIRYCNRSLRSCFNSMAKAWRRARLRQNSPGSHSMWCVLSFLIYHRANKKSFKHPLLVVVIWHDHNLSPVVTWMIQSYANFTGKIY